MHGKSDLPETMTYVLQITIITALFSIIVTVISLPAISQYILRFLFAIPIWGTIIIWLMYRLSAK